MSSNHFIPHFKTTGTHYECGFNIGKEFEKRIHKYLNIFTDFNETLVPYITSDYGRKVVDNFLSIISKRFPWYVDEMRGISEGSNIPFEQILAINFRVELLHITKHESDCEIIDDNIEETLMECSDFSLNNKDNKYILHNEDASISIYETGYIVSCHITSKDYNGIKSPDENFTCYCYPGHLPGNAFAFNSSGFTFSVDALLPKQISFNRFPRQIVSRYMLSAKTLKDLEDVVLNTPISYGFCLNLGYFGNDLSILKTDWNSEYFDNKDNSILNIRPVIWNYELAPNKNSNKFSLVSKHCIIPKEDQKGLDSSSYYSIDYCYHFNHYERIKIPECVVHSSRNRRTRADEMKPPENVQDLFNLAYDETNEKYPIYRIKEDYSVQCVSTALFDLKQKELLIYDGRISKTEPLLTISMQI